MQEKRVAARRERSPVQWKQVPGNHRQADTALTLRILVIWVGRAEATAWLCTLGDEDTTWEGDTYDAWKQQPRMMFDRSNAGHTLVFRKQNRHHSITMKYTNFNAASEIKDGVSTTKPD